jgi:hypothetical protein
MKKIHINEKKLNEIFNEDMNPKTEFELGLKKGQKMLDTGEYTTEAEEEIIDPDEEYAINYITSRLVDAQDIFTDLIDYLQNSPYAIERGGDRFKQHLSKATKICDELEKFWDNEETTT